MTCGRWELYAGLKDGTGSNDGDRLEARFDRCSDAVSDNQYIWITDYGNAAIRQIDVYTGEVTTLLDSGDFGGAGPHAIGYSSYGNGYLMIATTLDHDDEADGEYELWLFDFGMSSLTSVHSGAVNSAIIASIHGTDDGYFFIAPTFTEPMMVYDIAAASIANLASNLGRSMGVHVKAERWWAHDSFRVGIGDRLESVHESEAFDYATDPDWDDRSTWVGTVDMRGTLMHMKRSFLYDDDDIVLVTNGNTGLKSDDSDDPDPSEMRAFYLQLFDDGSCAPTEYLVDSLQVNNAELTVSVPHSNFLGLACVECCGLVFMVSENDDCVYVYRPYTQATTVLPTFLPEW